VRALYGRFPQLRETLARVDLGVRETPVESWRIGDATLLIKRDDLSAPALGGNKVRALELLLTGVRPGDAVLTVGATGSTHALAVAEHAASLGLHTAVITWPQEANDVADATARRLALHATVTRAGSVGEAFLRASIRRLRGRVHWVPVGGSVPLGALGHAGAALEVAEQLARQGIRAPDSLVVPLGSGGTVAGLLVGLAVAELPTRVIGARVVPGIVANRRRVLRLARRTHALLSELAGVPLPPLDASRLELDDTAYGGAYGRATREGRDAAARLRDAGGPLLDPTYSAKAFSVALSQALRSPDERILFWLTFDGRWLDAGDSAPAASRSGPLPIPR
jgi:D-cysteine desulfhydrase